MRTVWTSLLLVVTFVGLALGTEYKSHPSINIGDNGGLVEENGIVSGQGTSASPYVISGWRITTGSQGTVRISQTDAYVDIVNCLFVGQTRQSLGVILVKAANVTLRDCIFEELKTGIFCYQTSNVEVEDCILRNCRRGVDVTEATDFAIASTEILKSSDRGVSLWRSHSAVISECVFTECGTGIYLDSCRSVTAKLCHARSGNRGMFLWDSFDCTIRDSLIECCDLGVALVHTSAGNVVKGNAFVDNTRHASCDEADNMWDGGYPQGGNFWKGIDLTDRFSGPGQDECGSDGIADTPVVIPVTECRDRYPLATITAAPFGKSGSITPKEKGGAS